MCWSKRQLQSRACEDELPTGRSQINISLSGEKQITNRKVMTSEDSNSDFAQAYKELNEAEQHASVSICKISSVRGASV